MKGVRTDGSLVVRRDGPRRGGSVVLPASYVAEHVDLGYAITAHRAQGVTVDTAHVVVADTTTRESLYVAMTRGRDHNHAYVITHTADESHGIPEGHDVPSAREALTGVLAHTGAEMSATQTITAEQATWGGIRQLAAEIDTLASAAQRDRWARLLTACGLTDEQRDDVVASDAYGTLAAELRRAEANGHDVERILPAAVARHRLDDAHDLAAVLRHRLRLATAHSGRAQGRRPARMIAGLIPAPLGPMTPEFRRAIAERALLIEQRAKALALTALKSREPWVKQLGDPPTLDRGHWLRHVITVAAYRDRYGITSRAPLGGSAADDAQGLDRARADLAVRRLISQGMDSARQRRRVAPAGLGR